VLTGSIFAFISAMDETVVGLFISGASTSRSPNEMFTALRDEIDPTIAAISTLIDSRIVHPGTDRQRAAEEKRLTAVSVPELRCSEIADPLANNELGTEADNCRFKLWLD